MELKYIVGNELKFKLFKIIQFGYAVQDINMWMQAVKCNNKKKKKTLNIKYDQFSKNENTFNWFKIKFVKTLVLSIHFIAFINGY